MLLLSILFKYLTAIDPLYEDEADSMDKKSPFFKSEREIENEAARLPCWEVACHVVGVRRARDQSTTYK